MAKLNSLSGGAGDNGDAGGGAAATDSAIAAADKAANRQVEMSQKLTDAQERIAGAQAEASILMAVAKAAAATAAGFK
jgi:hypothetical protein